MKERRDKSILWGLAVIAFGVFLLLDNMGMWPELPLMKIAVLIVVGIVFFGCLRKADFLGMSFNLGVAACLFSKEIGIGNVSVPIILLVAVLIGVGLSLIFGKSHFSNFTHIDVSDRNVSSYSQGEGEFDVDNNLGAKTEYIQVKNIRRGKIDNALGKMTVYMNGSTIDPAGAFIDMDNGLGKLIAFIPKEFRVTFVTDNGLGKVNIHGDCSHDETLPLVTVKLDNGLGDVDIYFE